ncbi:hypothetical protein LR393_01665 [Kineosporia mesophila]|uniref:hypothetical protein n=1 Tax=Kineosporia mesophila TaxID=566012 RepID=UPI001E5C4367|nr:hypothetical protein [Kineosporia mesophila]MCD5348781.1 hypothetical protein [Kineosporia mesophila]
MARTITSAVRLLDELDVLRGDDRIAVSFWLDERSRFSHGARDLLLQRGVRILTDDEQQKQSFDLILTASENTAIPEDIETPILLLPHGVGFHKHLRDVDGTPRLSGVTLTNRPGLRVAIAHESQRTQLSHVAPELAGKAVLTRDSYFDRLRASQPLRTLYREALHVGPRRLVLISSTWGEQALLTRQPDLPSRLLAALPADEFAVALALHPNLWSAQGDWQIRTRLAEALDAGLLLVPAGQGWPASVVAADLVVGDHGSVTFYSAALGRPILLTGDGGPEMVPETPMHRLISSATRLRGTDLRDQVSDASPVSPAIRDAAFSGDHDVHHWILDALGLPPREQTPHRAWPAAHVDAAAVASFQVHTSSRPDGSLRIERFPAAVGAYLPEVVRASSHLATYDDELDLGRRDSASVMLSRSVREPAQTREWLEEHSRQRFLAAVAEPGNTVLVRLRGQLSRVTGSGDAALVSAALHHLVQHGSPRGPVRVTLGPITVKLEISPQ